MGAATISTSLIASDDSDHPGFLAPEVRAGAEFGEVAAPDQSGLGATRWSEAGTGYRAVKRILDLVCVVSSLPIAGPLALAGALAVMLTMGRPILYFQPRVGLGGRIFRIVKLRTMLFETPDSQPAPTAKQDSRITPVGRWLRRFHIDEIPQLWNVLAGEMSIIGPRPEQPFLSELYRQDTPAFGDRDRVRPGMTGWAQVKAGYAANVAETRVKLAYDLFYIKNMSFVLDVRILARTLWVLISGAGAR